MKSNRSILIWLNNIGVSNFSMEYLISEFSSLKDILTISNRKLNLLKMDKRQIKKIENNRREYNIEEIYEELTVNNIDVITIYDNYPKPLNNIYDKPYVLYVKGSIIEDDKLSICIVGSRKSTNYGRWACENFVTKLVGLDLTIVSGLALGIDTISHKTAIKENGRTLAVLGNGLDIKYPSRNRNLYDSIIDSGGIITEFPLGTKPFAYNFPRRNRIIAGLSLGIIVIEAEKKSGSIITAHHGLEQGKPVFALPGNINSLYSKGTNLLIKDGAKPLLSIEDIIEEIKEIEDRNIEDRKLDYSDLSKLEKSIIDLLLAGPMHCDLISHRLNIKISELISVMTILEMKDLVREVSGRIFTLV